MLDEQVGVPVLGRSDLAEGLHRGGVGRATEESQGATISVVDEGRLVRLAQRRGGLVELEEDLTGWVELAVAGSTRPEERLDHPDLRVVEEQRVDLDGATLADPHHQGRGRESEGERGPRGASDGGREAF